MSKFVVAPHFRLHEWVAEEKGYFAAEGLDYEFRETMDSSFGQRPPHRQQGRRLSDARSRAAPAMSAAPAIGP